MTEQGSRGFSRLVMPLRHRLSVGATHLRDLIAGAWHLELRMLHRVFCALVTLVLCACSDATPMPTNTPAPTRTPSPTATALATPTVQPTQVVLQSPIQSPIATPSVSTYTYEIVRTYSHDPSAFTEGLVYTNGRLFESTGLNGQSTLREVDLATGKVLRTKSLEQQYFGEGLALVGDRLIQLTWTSQVGFVYDHDTFKPLGTFSYTHEGWGLAYNGQLLALSDGTPTLRFLDPQTLMQTRQIQVTDRGNPVMKLNELEWVNGDLLANIWQTDWVVRIDPQTGVVTGRIDLSGLISEADRAEAQAAGRGLDVLNGIAYDVGGDRLFVTGKLWPKLFEIKLVPR
jgi:glutaminyl-peptide cyclotransferase